MLGVASVLGGFSISDSQRRQAEKLFVRIGGLDKLNVKTAAAVSGGSPTALQSANLGLRSADGERGAELDRNEVGCVGEQKLARVRVRSAFSDQERQVTGVGGDYLAIQGFELE